MPLLEEGRSLAGYTLDDVLANNRFGPPASATARAAEIRGRTLLDVIRDEEPSAAKGLFGKDKRTWKSFREKLRLKRAGSAWVSTVPIPTSDMPFQPKRSLMGKRSQVRFNTPSSRNSTDHSARNPSEESSKSIRRQVSRQSSTMNSSSDSTPFQYDESFDYSSIPDSAPSRMRPQMSRHTSIRIPNPTENYTDLTEPDHDNRVRHISSAFSERRMMSARETVAAQEAADAAAAAAAAEATSEPVRMSLMDLLHETDREMGFEGSNYGMGFEEDGFSDEEDVAYEEEDEDDGSGGEFSCCVCMVKHKNAPMAACGHTFCRLCSKELMVSRGNCPTCSDFILEMLEAF